MFDELLTIVGGLMDKLANSDEGHKIIDDSAAVVGRLYRNLTEQWGLPPEVAATVCGSIGKLGSSKS